LDRLRPAGRGDYDFIKTMVGGLSIGLGILCHDLRTEPEARDAATDTGSPSPKPMFVDHRESPVYVFNANNNYSVFCSMFSCTSNKYRPDLSKLQQNWKCGWAPQCFRITLLGDMRFRALQGRYGAQIKPIDPMNDLRQSTWITPRPPSISYISVRRPLRWRNTAR